MIVFDRVTFGYGDRRVLRDATFTINKQERVAILGGSGEGKTTILKLIMGLIKPDEGSILIDGEDISDKNESELRSVRMKFSLVFQEGALFDSLNVKENVAFCLREYTKMTEEEIDRRVRELLRIVAVEHAVHLMPNELSGGMHRRVAIARSLAATDPAMFLYDEPTSGLDPISADTICRLITDLAGKGKGLIIVTHKVSDAIKVADRFIFLKEGKIVFDGGRDGLLSSSHPDIRMFVDETRSSMHVTSGGGNV